ncbi:MAG: asparagine synthase (glutamine-hydrolyzing) [bacterium]
MCGIAGFISSHNVTASVAPAMQKGIRQRGPDAQNIQYWGKHFRTDITTGIHAAFIHTRLSIRDLSEAANQPMSACHDQVWLCYNGEIYDWEQDAKSLQKQGYVFKTHSDTEYIINAYLAYGFEEMLKRLRGMFAIAILDLRQQKLYVVRDRFGVKPLLFYYDSQHGTFAFGSTVRSVLPFLPYEQRVFSSVGIDAYLAHRYIPAPFSVFEHIQRLENATSLELDLKTYRLQKRCYWRPEESEGDWQTELDCAIRLRTMADRPVGVYLSGGVDSSTIVARLHALGFDNLTCFSAAFPGTGFDESDEAKVFANQLGLSHEKIVIPKQLGESFNQLVADLDEPFADPSSIPSWYLARETVKAVTVVLGGDGGDEIFAGYKRYQKHLRSAKRFVLPDWFHKISGWQPKGWRKLLVESTASWQDAYAFRFSGLHLPQRRFLQPDFHCRIHYWRQPDDNLEDIEYLLEIDRLNYLPEYIMRKADLCTMAHGLEQRVPLLDHVFYQKLKKTPSSQRFTQPAKQLLGNVAPEIKPIFFRKKRGFNPPLADWLQHDLLGRRSGLGQRLEFLTAEQISQKPCDELITRYYQGESALAEQVLQLYILDESLQQLNSLRQNRHD